MNVTYLKTISAMPKVNQYEISKRLAYHAAGCATSICLNNNNKDLPPVFFRIVKGVKANGAQGANHLHPTQILHSAKVEGGRLIQELPVSFEEVANKFTRSQKQFFDLAFEADVANVLAGPLAEAKYVAHRDDEAITARLVNLKALSFYNGAEEVDLVSKYFECIHLSPQERDKKIVDIYFDTFRFISEYSHWRAIGKLAEHILTSDRSVIEAEEAFAVIESSFDVNPSHQFAASIAIN